jgi:D-alanyl-D-alanine carboxypeptidase/D-alanyl-D-alanine-endopeptidase (penicillin-binding protein 4)
MIKKIILVLLITSECIISKDNDLYKQINTILNSVPKNTKYGILIYNPKTRDTLFKKNIYEKIKPASNTKLFTTAAALSLIGSDSSIATKILTDDLMIDSGTIDGNLYIKGFGNSLFTDHDLDSLVTVIKALGIKNIKGKIIGDDTYFDSEYKRSDWIIDESDFDPLPPVSAIAINKNKIQFNLHAFAKTGGKVSYSFYPECSLIVVKNLSKIVRQRSSIHISQQFGSDKYEFTISGSLKRNSYRTYTIEINNPPLFAALLLKDRLINAGIKVEGSAESGQVQRTVNELCENSNTIERLCSVANKTSDNFVAECLFKTVGACFSNNQGSGFYGTQAIYSYLKENRIYSDDIIIVDGSGLSHQNQVTVLTIVNLLERIYRNPNLFFDFYNSLSIAGKDGTLRHRFIGSNAENNFHGKTGSLHGVIALSGFMKSKSGEDLIISTLFEYHRGGEAKYKNIIKRIVELL